MERLICGPPQSKRNGDSPRCVNHRIDEDPDLSLVSPIVGRAIALMAATTPRGPNGHEMLKGKEQDLNTRIAFAEAINFDTRYYNQRLQKEMTDLEPKITSLEARMKAKQVTKEELDRQKQDLAQPDDSA